MWKLRVRQAQGIDRHLGESGDVDMAERSNESSGRKGGEGPFVRSAGSATEADRGGEDWRVDEPVLLGSTVLARQSESQSALGRDRTQPKLVAASKKLLPKGWAVKGAEYIWAGMSERRPPLAVVAAGAEGGVGTSTIAALIGESVAAASPGPSAIVDQAGSSWGSLSRRILGQRAGLPGHVVLTQLARGMSAAQLFVSAPTSAAGAAVLTDRASYTPLTRLFALVRATCGAMVVDGGRVDALLAARLNPLPIVVIVGRADVIGAEAVCAALGFLQRWRVPAQPLVVLCNTVSGDRRQIQAARRLLASAGVTTVVHLPYDSALSNSKSLRLNNVSKSTATACLQLLRRIQQFGEALDRGP